MSIQIDNNISNNNIINIDLSYLENCVSQLYNPNPNNQIKEYVEKVKNYYSINLNLIPNLFEFFNKSTIPQFQFWDLDLLINLTNNFYPHIPNETKQLIRQLIISLIQNQLMKLYKMPYISSKFCLFIITWLKYDYPQNFSTFFNDLISQIINVKDNDLKMKYIIFFIDLLLIFDDELIKFRHTYTEFESKKSNEIKDFIRLHCINDIISVINELLSNEQYIDDKIINKSIQAISQLIDWNLLNVFQNVIPLILTNLIIKQKYMIASLEVVNALIKKGMEVSIKIEIVNQFKIKEVLNSILNTNNIGALDVIGEILNNLGLVSLIGLGYDTQNKTDKNNNISNINFAQNNNTQVFNPSCNLLGFVLSTCQMIIKKKQYKTCLSFIEFLQGLLNYFKLCININNNILTMKEFSIFIIEFINEIMNTFIIPQKLYNLNEISDIEELKDDDYFSYRKEYIVIIENFYSLNLFKIPILDYIILLCENKSTSLYSIEQELFILNNLQHGIKNSNTLNENAVIERVNKIFIIVFSEKYTQYNNNHIILLYYDTLIKYMSLNLENKEIIRKILELFFSEKGIVNPNLKTGSKIANLFDKFLDKIKSKIENDTYISIYNKLKEYITLIIQSNNFPLISQYDSLYHSISTVINFISPELKEKNYEEILKLIITIFENYGVDEFKFCDVTKCLTQFLSSINHEIKNDNIKQLFQKFFEAYINKYFNQVQNNYKSILSLITLLQRVVIILGNNSVSFIDFFFQLKIKNMTIDLYEELSGLLLNLLNIKINGNILVEKYYEYFFIFVGEKISIPKQNISDHDKKIFLVYTSFLKLTSVIFSSKNFSVFYKQNTKITIEHIIQFILYLTLNINEGNSRKISLKIIQNILLNLDNDVNTQRVKNLFKTILNNLFETYKLLDLKNSNDNSCFIEILRIHSIISNINGGRDYYDYLKSIGINDENAVIMMKGFNIKKSKVEEKISQGFNVRILYNFF